MPGCWRPPGAFLLLLAVALRLRNAPRNTEEETFRDDKEMKGLCMRKTHGLTPKSSIAIHAEWKRDINDAPNLWLWRREWSREIRWSLWCLCISGIFGDCQWYSPKFIMTTSSLFRRELSSFRGNWPARGISLREGWDPYIMTLTSLKFNMDSPLWIAIGEWSYPCFFQIPNHHVWTSHVEFHNWILKVTQSNNCMEIRKYYQDWKRLTCVDLYIYVYIHVYNDQDLYPKVSKMCLETSGVAP